MKIATSSRSFSRELASGDLTQIEWLDLCAADIDLDGVLLQAEHFPRTDDEYLAQVKKMAADRGLTIAGYAAGADAWEDAAPALAIALTLGAPLLVLETPAAGDDPNAWNDLASAAKRAASAAKSANVTIAVRHREGTLCARYGDLKRLHKDADSAWLRFALDPLHLATDESLADITSKTVITFVDDSAITEADLAQIRTRARGFIVIDVAEQDNPRAALSTAIATLRRKS